MLAKLTKPIVADGIWFHTFNHMRTQIDKVNAAIIQPFVWEALTHLKCVYPDMYKANGVATPPQKNFYMVTKMKWNTTKKYLAKQSLKPYQCYTECIRF